MRSIFDSPQSKADCSPSPAGSHLISSDRTEQKAEKNLTCNGWFKDRGAHATVRALTLQITTERGR